jgi:peroxiredoxin
MMACGSENGQTNNAENRSEQSRETSSLHQYGIDTGAHKPSGLKTGQKAPDFQGITDQGDSVAVNRLLAEGPVVLMFYRGQWCPVCNQYLKGFEDSLALIREKGAKVVAVTPETPANARKMRKKTGTSIAIIPDTTESIMKQYGVNFRVTGEYAQKIEEGFGVNIAETNNDQRTRLPVLATYLIDQNGNIAWRFFNPNYKKRAMVKAIVEELEKL